MNWQTAISECHRRADPFAVVTVISTTGSTPRSANAKMVVTGTQRFDTIGGGDLEFQAISLARELLTSSVPQQKLEHVPLATKAGQCCGGSVTLLVESFPVTAMRLAIFGAGHVGESLVRILAECDVRIEWIDQRTEQFPADLPSNVRPVVMENPCDHVQELKDFHRCVILTHDHQLDYQLTKSLLTETEIDYVGLIGSDTKAKRFFSRLTSDGVSADDQRRCHCPIGLASVNGKLPMEIAVAIAAQILSLDPIASSELKPALSWKQIRQVTLRK